MTKKINGIIVLALMVTAGCSSKSAVAPGDGSAGSAGSGSVSSPSSSLPLLPSSTPSGYGFDQWQTGPLGDVFFDYDSATLSTEAQDQLKKNEVWLESNSSKSARVEGHCDERGTSEYNVALGDRRAARAKEYLVRLGVAPSRIETVSYGEERPFDLGRNEESWAKNRRAHFVVK